MMRFVTAKHDADMTLLTTVGATEHPPSPRSMDRMFPTAS